MSSKIASVLLSLPLLFCGCAYWPDLFGGQSWVEVETEHFTVLTNVNESEAVELADELERFRQVVEYVIRQPIPAARVPTYVFAFSRPREYEKFAPHPAILGYFTASPRSNALVFPLRDAQARHIYQHEYVHFLFSNDARLAYPRCYEEGFAEMVATTRFLGEQVEIGRATKRPRNVTWTPLEKLLATNPSGREYVQCWAFVHYLSFSDVDSDAITAYMRERENGSTIRDSVESAFGMDVDTLDEQVRDYVIEGRFPYITTEASRFETEAARKTRPVSGRDALIRLGTLLVAMEMPWQAQLYFEEARKRGADDARLWAGLGDVALMQDDLVTAEAHYQRMLELAPGDPLSHLDYATYLRTRADRAESDDARARFADEARASVTRAWQIDDSLPEVYYAYGMTWVGGPHPEKGRESLEHANDLLPGERTIQLGLAKLYEEMGDTQLARATLHRVVAGSHDSALPEWAVEFLDQTRDSE